MKWKIDRNINYSSHDTSYRGECSRLKEIATLSIHLNGKQESKSDLQPTFTSYIKECSLLKKRNEKDTSCILSCPVFEEYKNGHNY